MAATARGGEAPFLGAGWTFNRPGSILASRPREPCDEAGVRILRFFPPPGAVRVPCPAVRREIGDWPTWCSRPIPIGRARSRSSSYFFFFFLLLRALLLSTLLLGHGSITSLALTRLEAADPSDSAWTISPATFGAASSGRPCRSRVRHDALRVRRSSMHATRASARTRCELSRCENDRCGSKKFRPAGAWGVDSAVESRANCQFSWGLAGRTSVSRCENQNYARLSTSL